MIEQELVRQQLYSLFIQEVFERLKDKLKWKDVKALMLRYVFNRISGRQLEAPEHHRFECADMKDSDIQRSMADLGDPVFCHHESKWADMQLQRDFAFSKLEHTHATLLTWIPERFGKMCADLKDRLSKVDSDLNSPIFVQHSKRLSYTTKKGHVIQLGDISNLGALHAKHLDNAMALQLRYRYLNLENHGLAFPYANFGHMSGGTEHNSTLEGFASAFNHYFPNFCSAFPDLERPYGSMGSFFMLCNSDPAILATKFSKWMVNPVFDETLMNNVVTQILHLYNVWESKSLASPHITCIFPNWKEFRGVTQLKTSIWARNVQVFPKGQLKFIQHFQVPPVEIAPCDIFFAELGPFQDKDTKRQKLEK